MKLWYSKTSKDPTYFVQIGVRNGKKVSSKNIFRIGRHSELLAQNILDPLAYSKEVVEKYNEEYKNQKVSFNVTIDFDTKLTSSDAVESSLTSLNIGYLCLQKIYSQLKIDDFINDLTEKRRFKFNSNDINRFFVFDRILAPKSKFASLNDLANFYEEPQISYQHVLRFMDALASNADSYISHLYTNSENIIKRDTSVCYYDCTNYYFEIESADDGDYGDVTGEVRYWLRQYGISKEHRPNPLVQMGLFIDKNGIPLSMCINPGNQNEQVGVCEHERKLVKMLKNKRIIYCADAGLGSVTIRNFNNMNDRAFIIAQSIKKLPKDIQEEIFEDKNYKLLSNNESSSLEEMKNFDIEKAENNTLFNDKIYKTIEVDVDVDLGLFEEKKLKNGDVKLVKAKSSLKQKIIVTYSRKMANYQKIIRDNQIERAKKLLQSTNPEDIKKGPSDVRRFLTLKDKPSKKEYMVDENRIALESKYDGFYALATNLDDDVKEILAINSNRYQIEDCFRTLKTYFNARPIYHRLSNRIISHFLICYTALLIFRLLEAMLKKKKYNFTITQILNTIRSMNVIKRNNLYYESIYSNSQVCMALNDVFNLGLDKKYYPNNYFKKLIKKF